MTVELSDSVSAISAVAASLHECGSGGQQALNDGVFAHYRQPL